MVQKSPGTAGELLNQIEDTLQPSLFNKGGVMTAALEFIHWAGHGAVLVELSNYMIYVFQKQNYILFQTASLWYNHGQMILPYGRYHKNSIPLQGRKVK